MGLSSGVYEKLVEAGAAYINDVDENHGFKTALHVVRCHLSLRDSYIRAHVIVLACGRTLEIVCVLFVGSLHPHQSA